MNPDKGWSPSASLEALRMRAALLAEIRAFFAERGVLEVETPVLSHAGATDPNLDSFITRYRGPGAADGATLYLHTSPEFPMKRLLAAGSGPIYQVCRVFRNGEAGRRHNPEFTLLEWYRPGLDHHQLMDEVETLLRTLLRERVAPGAARRLSYAEAFLTHAGVDPHQATVAELARAAADRRIAVPDGMPANDRDPWLDLLLTQRVEPALAAYGLCFLYDYPASQAALARIRRGTPPVAERFEVYLHGMELANGFHELIDAGEQGERFARERQRRRDRGRDDVAPDQHLLTALAKGLPPVAGVALGLDRLLMVLAGAGSIEQVIAFPIDRA
ncbi:MAG: EF-P lysine aminoacylase EpmA [Gammaproteobacteria bacterium]